MLVILTTSRAVGYEPPIREFILKSQFLDLDDKLNMLLNCCT
jgi:hypothetical protein